MERAKVTRRLFRKLHRKSTRRRLVRIGLVAGNLIILLGVMLFVLQNSSTSQADISLPLAAAAGGGNDAVTSPLDRVSSVDIALTVARMGNLSEQTPIANQAQSQLAVMAMAPTDNSIAAKPQVVTTALKSRKDIQVYVTKAGDTISSIATRFGVTSDSIKWSNGLTGDDVAVNQSLYIPPVNGIVYKVKSGDTPASLATKFKADKNLIIAYNDAELSGLKPGELIIVPNGTKPAPIASYFSYGGWGFTPTYGSNGYAYGWCTWYVASRVAMPSNWGNANTWDDYARLSGWTVSSVPKAGAIAQTDGMSYLGHVAYVEAVSADGTKIKYSDMAGLAGWGAVGYSNWVPASTFPHYIYK